MNVATPNNLTVPTHTNVPYDIGVGIDVTQYGAGKTTIVGDTGVTIRGAAGTRGQYAGVSIYKRAENEWVVVGGE
jgi:hypothetical protein